MPRSGHPTPPSCTPPRSRSSMVTRSSTTRRGRVRDPDRHGRRRATGCASTARPVKLRGACIHHDNGVIGAHTLDAADDRRIRILKESGFNAIRSAHNPASRALLRACDRHGVLVMDELTDAWWRPKVTYDYTAEFEEWWERDLEALVAKDVNHPSVIMYSIGNEIAETATDARHRAEPADRRPHPRAGPDAARSPTASTASSTSSPRRTTRSSPRRTPPTRESGEASNKNLIVILNYLMAVLDKIADRTSSACPGRRQAHARRLRRARRRRLQLHGRPLRASTRGCYPHRVIVGSETNPTRRSRSGSRSSTCRT